MGLVLLVAIASIWIDGLVSAPIAQTDIASQIRSYLDKAPIKSLQLTVYDGKTDRLIFEHRKGQFNPQAPVAIASATKWVTGAVFMAMATDGILQPTDTTGKWLNWQGAAGQINLKHLLSFTSGLNQGGLCQFDHRSSLDNCTQQVNRASRNPQPESFFEYGATHMMVAGRMAEVATKQSWDQIFAKYITQPLGLLPQTRYGGGTIGDRRILAQPTRNPRLDGGLQISSADYTKFLRMVYQKGKYNGRQIIRPDLIAMMETSQFKPQTKIKYSPAARYPYKMEYGLGNWVECIEANCTRQVNSSLGAFGFYPWIDRQNEYYGILAMEQDRGGSESAKLIVPGRVLIEKLVAQARL
jgi:CubicO group peptidase (beta-lactamase class C family)